jgi:ubiquinone/menaquinone biosynthesis C-methylase UbiE
LVFGHRILERKKRGSREIPKIHSAFQGLRKLTMEKRKKALVEIRRVIKGHGWGDEALIHCSTHRSKACITEITNKQVTMEKNL